MSVNLTQINQPTTARETQVVDDPLLPDEPAGPAAARSREAAHGATPLGRHAVQPVRTAEHSAPVARVSDRGQSAPARRRRPGHGPTPRPMHEVPAPNVAHVSSDSGRGLPLLLIFLAAILVMVIAVWIAAAVSQWWILIPVIGVDLLATTAVLATPCLDACR
jgi:hypothetical protein